MKRILFIAVIIAIAGAGAYLVYQSFSGSKKPPGTEEVSDDAIKVSKDGENFSLEEIKNPASVDYGVRIYPGAKPDSNEKLSSNVQVNNQSFIVGSFTTSDSLNKVVSFYKKQLGSEAVVSEFKDRESVCQVISKSGENLLIRICSEDNVTKFSIINARNQE